MKNSAGAVVGYIASMVMRPNSRQGQLLDIVVGVLGALLAGHFISPPLGVGTLDATITRSTLPGFVILLWIYKMVAQPVSGGRS